MLNKENWSQSNVFTHRFIEKGKDDENLRVVMFHIYITYFYFFLRENTGNKIQQTYISK